MITLFSNTLIKSRSFGKVEFQCLKEVSFLQPVKISIISTLERDRDCWANTDIDIVNVTIGEKSQLYYNDGKENQEHRANSVFFKDLVVDNWNHFDKNRPLMIEMFNYGNDDARVNVCLWCEE
jgi:hypothetical protein